MRPIRRASAGSCRPATRRQRWAAEPRQRRPWIPRVRGSGQEHRQVRGRAARHALFPPSRGMTPTSGHSWDRFLAPPRDPARRAAPRSVPSTLAPRGRPCPGRRTVSRREKGDSQVPQRSRGSCGEALGRSGRGRCGSPSRLPVTASSSMAASPTLRVSGPKQVSPLKASGSGQVEIRPRWGFSPTRPVQAAGMRTEPAPSEPIAPPTNPAATAAAPPLEPPGVGRGVPGLGGGAEGGGLGERPLADLWRMGLADHDRPAARRRRTIPRPPWPAYGGRRSRTGWSRPRGRRRRHDRDRHTKQGRRRRLQGAGQRRRHPPSAASAQIDPEGVQPRLGKRRFGAGTAPSDL